MSQQHRNLLQGWNSLPNLVTYARIVLMLGCVVCLVMAGTSGVEHVMLRVVAAVLFIVAASTDKLDGYLARKHNAVTDLGKLLDPIADKLLVCSVLIVLSLFSELSWWITGLFLLREVAVTVMRFLVIHSGGKVIAASQFGKYKTLAQCIGLSMLLLPVWMLGSGDSLAWWQTAYYAVTYLVLDVALFLCLYSGGLYCYDAVMVLKHPAQHGAVAGATSEADGLLDVSAPDVDGLVGAPAPASVADHMAELDTDGTSEVAPAGDPFATQTHADDLFGTHALDAADSVSTAEPFGSVASVGNTASFDAAVESAAPAPDESVVSLKPGAVTEPQERASTPQL